MYELLKSDFDFAKARYEDIVEKRQQAGKQGGAPKGNRNTAKDNISDQVLKPVPKQAKQVDKSSKITVVSNQITYKRSSGSSEVVFYKQQQTTTTFINKCKALGYSIDSQRAKEIFNTAGLDPTWFSGAYTYPEFIAEYVRDIYQNKSPHEKKNLFTALLGKEDKMDEYPEWRKAREAEASAQEKHRQKEIAAQEKRQRIDTARKNKPTACDHCGKPVAAMIIFSMRKPGNGNLTSRLILPQVLPVI